MSPTHINKRLQKLSFRNLVSMKTVLEEPLVFKNMNSKETNTSWNLVGGMNKYIFSFRILYIFKLHELYLELSI